MVKIFDEISRTFEEYLLVPNLTTKQCIPSRIQLTTAVSRNKRKNSKPTNLNIPIVSAAMQAVSNHTLAIELARSGSILILLHLFYSPL